MAENFDLKGTIEFDSTQAVRAFDATSRSVSELFDDVSNLGDGFAGLAEALDATLGSVQDTATQLARLNQLTVEQQSSLVALNKITPLQGWGEAFRTIEVAAKERIDAEKRAQEDYEQYIQKVISERIALEERKNDRILAAERRRHEAVRAFETEREQLADQTRRRELKSLQDNIRARAQAEDEAVKQQEKAINQLANTRYALYDVARTWTVISAATLGTSAAITKFAADYQQSFASVTRTTKATGVQLQNLREDLVDLTTNIPKQFDEITGIATLGAQMDVASEDLEKFTSVVSMFASTTDVSIEKTAMGLGRLSQLTKTPTDDIDRLASSIYQVGVTSVATEGQILAIAEQIAVSGNLAGLANHEIVGLAGALASLGVQPEAARGSIMRIFADIRKAVDAGGDSLTAFADLAGTSAATFAQAWLTQPQQAFMALVQGLERVAQEGGSVNGVMEELGFSNVRDIRIWQLLADNTEVYADALDEAASAYADNSALADGYAVQVDNLNDKLTLLFQTIQALGAEVGSIPGLEYLVEQAHGIAQAVLEFVRTPVGAALAKLAFGLTTVIGALAAYRAMIAITTASTYGLITAQRGIAAVAGQVQPGLRGLLQVTRELITSNNQLTSATTASATAIRAQGVAAADTGGKIRLLSTVGQGASTAIKGVGGALLAVGRAVPTIAAVTAGLAAVSWVVDKINDALKSDATKFEELIGGLGGLQDALKLDMTTFKETGDGIEYIARKTNELSNEQRANNDASAVMKDGQLGVAEVVDATTEAIERQKIVVGNYTKELLANKINEELFGSMSIEAQRALAGLDISGLMDAFIEDTANGTNKVGELLAGMVNDVKETNKQLMWEEVAYVGQRFDLQQELWALESQASTTAEFARIEVLKQEISQLDILIAKKQSEQDANREVIDSISQLDGKAKGFSDTLEQLSLSQGRVNQLLGETSEDAEDADNALTNYANKVSELTQQLFGFISAQAGMQDSLEKLGASFYENANAFDIYSESGRANLKAVEQAFSSIVANVGADSTELAVHLYQLLEAVQAQGIDTTETLAHVHKYLEDILNAGPYGLDFSTEAARKNLKAFVEDAIKTLYTVDHLENNRRLADAQARLGPASIAKEMEAHSERKRAIDEQIRQLEKLHGELENVRDVTPAVERGFTNAFNKASEKASKAKKDIAEVKEEVKTLTDYARELGSVFKAAFEIRFGNQQSQDKVADAYQRITDAADAAAEAARKAAQAIEDANAKIKGLQSDNKVLAYQLTVAREYGDSLRETQILAEMAKNNTELAKTEDARTKSQKDLKDAQDKLTKSLTNDTVASREHRTMVLDLVQAYQDQVTALANSGLSAEELERKTKDLRTEFVKQLTQMGYNRTEVNHYADAFKDMSTVIQKLPRNVTVKADANPAQRAINEFLAKNKDKSISSKIAAPAKSNLDSVRNSITKGLTPTITPKIQAPSTNDSKKAGEKAMKDFLAGFGQMQAHISPQGLVSGRKPNQYWTGGFTGRGGKYEPAGIVHRGEYVVPSQYVDQNTGLPDLNALGRLVATSTGRATGGSGGGAGGVSVVELSAYDRSLLEKLGYMQVNIDGTSITRTVNQHNKQMSTRGVI